MNNKLSEICENRLSQVAELKKVQPVAKLQDIISQNHGNQYYHARGFAEKINQKINSKHNALICEIKRASPSAGVINDRMDIVDIALSYEKSGAACISVLTEPDYFSGSNRDLESVRKATNLPILRKDFMVDEWQIYESRAIGADCILLIMAALDDSQAQKYAEIATSLDMDVLIEVHDELELKRAVNIDIETSNKLIGINNRDLKSLKVDLSVCQKLVASDILSGNDCNIICESGIRSKDDVLMINNSGVYGFLIGETLMSSGNISGKLSELLI